MVGTVLSQKPRRSQRFRNESSFAQSDAEQRLYHAEIAGRQYMILARIVARNSSWSDSVEMPWPRRTLITYSKLLPDVSKLFTWSVALSGSLSVMPRTLAQLTCSMFGHGGGGWDVARWWWLWHGALRGPSAKLLVNIRSRRLFVVYAFRSCYMH